MKVKLWIDDTVRAPDGWHWAKSNTEAIRILSDPNMEITELAIDHDIMHVVENENRFGLVGGFACPETFEATARFIRLKQTAQNSAGGDLWSEPLYITIQTGSSPGRKILMEILKDAPNTKVAVNYHKKPHDWTIT